jgi:hypothetical protein
VDWFHFKTHLLLFVQKKAMDGSEVQDIADGLKALQSPAVLEQLELAQRELDEENKKLTSAKEASAQSEKVLSSIAGGAVGAAGHQVQGWSEFGEEDIEDVGMHFMTKLVVTVGDLSISIAQDPDGDHIGTLHATCIDSKHRC